MCFTLHSPCVFIAALTRACSLHAALCTFHTLWGRPAADLKAMEAEVRAIHKEGLLWGACTSCPHSMMAQVFFIWCCSWTVGWHFLTRPDQLFAPSCAQQSWCLLGTASRRCRSQRSLRTPRLSRWTPSSKRKLCATASLRTFSPLISSPSTSSEHLLRGQAVCCVCSGFGAVCCASQRMPGVLRWSGMQALGSVQCWCHRVRNTETPGLRGCC